MLKKQKGHIKTRILVMLICLIVVIITSTTLALNLFLRTYVRSNVEEQLNELVQSVREHIDTNDEQKDLILPDLSLQSENKIGTKGDAFIISTDYQILESRIDDGSNTIEQIASYLEKMSISIDGIENIYISAEEGKYYISAISDLLQDDAYMVFYVDVTGIMGLVSTINIAMIIICALAMVISFIIANYIAGSFSTHVEELSGFAAQIGAGNFETKDLFFPDIEFNQLADAMNQAAKKLDAYEQNQQIFFQNASHELRTPLMAIQCYAEGISCGVMEPKLSSETILYETERMKELVEDLLYISRIDSLTDTIEADEHDLRETLSLCASSFRPVAERNHISFVFQFDEAPVWFQFDERHMERAFTNLISNALRYATTTVTLSCHQSETEIEIAVIDDGEGISDVELPYIFDRFYKGAGGNHGIGLSIVKSVIELYNGRISIICGEGTCFQVTFPKE